MREFYFKNAHGRTSNRDDVTQNTSKITFANGNTHGTEPICLQKKAKKCRNRLKIIAKKAYFCTFQQDKCFKLRIAAIFQPVSPSTK